MELLQGKVNSAPSRYSKPISCSISDSLFVYLPASPTGIGLTHLLSSKVFIATILSGETSKQINNKRRIKSRAVVVDPILNIQQGVGNKLKWNLQVCWVKWVFIGGAVDFIAYWVLFPLPLLYYTTSYKLIK